MPSFASAVMRSATYVFPLRSSPRSTDATGYFDCFRNMSSTQDVSIGFFGSTAALVLWSGTELTSIYPPQTMRPDDGKLGATRAV